MSEKKYDIDSAQEEFETTFLEPLNLVNTTHEELVVTFRYGFRAGELYETKRRLDIVLEEIDDKNNKCE